jgi:hypothetical protein
MVEAARAEVRGMEDSARGRKERASSIMNLGISRVAIHQAISEMGDRVTKRRGEKAGGKTGVR